MSKKEKVDKGRTWALITMSSMGASMFVLSDYTLTMWIGFITFIVCGLWYLFGK